MGRKKDPLGKDLSRWPKPKNWLEGWFRGALIVMFLLTPIWGLSNLPGGWWLWPIIGLAMLALLPVLEMVKRFFK